MYALRTLMIIALALTSAAFIACSGKVRTKAPSESPAPGKPDVVVIQDGQGQDENGPPDHAPAHGYRKKHQVGNANVVLEYSTSLGLYIVLNQDDCYYNAGQFYRLSSGAWEWSVRIEGPWKAVDDRNDLPPGLRKNKHGNKDKDKDKNK